MADATLTAADVLDAIRLGTLDGDLGAIARTANHRQKIVARATFRPGVEAVITGGLRPKYLIGTKVTVVKVNPKRIVVQMPAEAGRFSNQEVTVPAESLAVV